MEQVCAVVPEGGFAVPITDQDASSKRLVGQAQRTVEVAGRALEEREIVQGRDHRSRVVDKACSVDAPSQVPPGRLEVARAPRQECEEVLRLRFGLGIVRRTRVPQSRPGKAARRRAVAATGGHEAPISEHARSTPGRRRPETCSGRREVQVCELERSAAQVQAAELVLEARDRFGLRKGSTELIRRERLSVSAP